MRTRFIIALILAIFPFAVLSAGQAFWRLEHAHDAARASLLDAARAAAAPVANTIAAAEAVLRALEHQTDIISGGPNCAAYLANTLSGTSYYSNIARIDASGIAMCAALPIPESLRDRSKEDWFRDAEARGKFTLSAQHYGEMAKQNVLTAALPLVTADGKPNGVIALGLKSDFLMNLLHSAQLPSDAVAAVFDSHDVVIAATDPDMAPVLVSHDANKASNSLDEARDAKGQAWLYAVSELSGQDLRVVFAERENALLAWSYLDVVINLLVPFVMAGFAFAAIWFSADRFVLRWINYLQRVSRAYGAGHFRLRPSLATAEAPPEIRQLASAMQAMATSLSQRDASLRLALDQRSLMLKEIHHRVKNNLQTIASLLQIEARHVKEPAARDALSVTQTRISAIALAHRLLEEVGAQTVVNLRRLVGDLSTLLRDGLGDGLAGDDVSVAAPDILLDTDIAVPLALFLAEHLTGVYRRASLAGLYHLGLSITAVETAPGRLTLTIAHDKPQGAEPTDPSATRANFLSAYVRQLRGTLSMTGDGQRAETTMVFSSTLVTVSK